VCVAESTRNEFDCVLDFMKNYCGAPIFCSFLFVTFMGINVDAAIMRNDQVLFSKVGVFQG